MATGGEKEDQINSQTQDHGSNAPSSTGEAKISNIAQIKESNLSRLRTFQDLVGIRTPYHILSTGNITSQQLIDLEKGHKPNPLPEKGSDEHTILYAAGRPSRTWKQFIFKSTVSNDGIYGRSIDEALTASVWYNVSNFFINALYCLQIFIAATITGLASYHGHEIPLTVLGALNAVLAGLMALLKGQGLPVRMRRSRDQFQNVMKTIENTERMFARFVHMGSEEQSKHDPFTEFLLCENLFDAAKRDQQANYPDLYSNTNERHAVDKLNDNNQTSEQLQKTIDDLTSRLDKLSKPPEAGAVSGQPTQPAAH